MRRLLSIASLLPLLALPLRADDVHLRNGRVFEDVVTETTESTVTVHLAFGEITFSLDAVERIERAASSLDEYRSRRAELAANPGSGAADWIALARWALGRGQDHVAREAALRAAALDPAADGLDALMATFDHVYDPSLGRWITVEESLRLKGYELVDGHWLSAEQRLARSRASAEAALAREEADERRLTRAVLALAAAQMSRPAEPEVVYQWPVTVYPNPFVWHRPTLRPPSSYRPPTPRKLGSLPIERRQPGSLFPVAHRGSVQAPAASDRPH